MRTAAKSARGPAAAARSVDAAASDERLGSAALALLQLQSEMRKAASVKELAYFIANEPRELFRAQQIAVLTAERRGRFTVKAVSSVSHVDRSSPLVLWLEAIVRSLEQGHGLAEPRDFEVTAFEKGFAEVAAAYPLRQMMWMPMRDRSGGIGGGALMARTTPWGDTDLRLADHLAPAFGHAWAALIGRTPSTVLAPLMRLPAAAGATALALALSLLPVSMSALAPVEVAPREPFIVTSGVDGVIRSVAVAPGQSVKRGETLVVLEDTVLKNRAEVAEREAAVAETKYKKAAQLAFADVRGRHEMAVARSELELRLAERNFARELLERSRIKAERDGVALFADRKDLVGRPVTVGEKLMEIAQVAPVEFLIDLPVADAITLVNGARAKIFLDSDPLRPIEARLVRAAYRATSRDGQPLAFRLVAQAEAADATVPRLGVRGTAQVYSDTVALGFYLLRRPIAAARQWSGL